MATLAKKTENRLPNLLQDFFNVDRFFGDNPLDRDLWEMRKSFQMPSTNIVENEVEFKLEVALPGFDKNDIKVELDDRILTVSAEKQEEASNNENERCHRKEFSYNSFIRSFTMPENVKSDEINAKYENGILKMAIPKKDVKMMNPKKEINII